jgi:photosystem II stability/assembly factor-like uncharacterized protein
MKHATAIHTLAISSFLLMAFSFGCSERVAEKADKPKHERKEKSPEEPYEEFMLQRTYPNATFEINTYRTALNAAVQQASMQRSQQMAAWQLEGPGNIGGRFNCLAVHPTNSSIMYAGSANGGVWKTTDNGATWNVMTDALPYQAIGAIAINPSNANEIWIGTGDVNISGTMYAGNGVYKSTDAGLTWNYLGLSNTYVVSSIVFNSNNTSEVLIATMGNSFARDNNRGMYKTVNSGLSFTNTLFVNDSTGIIDMIQDPTTPNTVYCSSFTRLRTDRQSVLYGTEVYVYKSTDFGQNWTMLAGGLPNGNVHQRVGLAICKTSPNVLYASYSTSDGMTDPGLYKTINGGISWTQVQSNVELNSYGSFGWYFGKIYVDPNDPNTLYLPGVDLQKSTNGGQTFTIHTPPWWMYDVHADGHWMHFASSTNYIYCTDGGLYRTLDGGVNWTDIENIPNNQFYAVTENPHNLGEYAGGVQDNGTMYGNLSVFNNYTRLYGGDGFTVTYAPNATDLVYTETQYGNIVFDDFFPNGNWQNINMDPGQFYAWHTPYLLSAQNPSVLYYGGQQVARITGAPYGNSTNISPVLVDPQSPARVQVITTIHESPLDQNVLYAGTADGKVWNSLDYGVNWNDVTPFQNSSYYVTCVLTSPNNVATAYVTRSGYRSNDNTPLVFKTTDNGATWTNVSGNLPALAVNDILVMPGDENILFVANDAGVYYTTDGGVNWQRLGTGMPFVAVLDIHFNSNQSKIIAGSFGRSIYTTDISTITGVDEPAMQTSISLFPNPTSDFLQVETSLNVDRLRVYDLSGKLVLTTTEKRISVASLASGVYVAEIGAGETVSRMKFVKR